MNQIINTSITVAFLRHLYKQCRLIKQRLIDIYSDSQTDRLIKAFKKKVKICFQYSFFGKISEKEKPGIIAVGESRVARVLLQSFKNWNARASQYLKTSSTGKFLKTAQDELNFSPARVIAVMVITGIVVNLAFLIIAQRQISLWSGLFRILLLFVGIAGIFCKADWRTFKKNSIFLRGSQGECEKD